MNDSEFEISLNRKTFTLWTIPADFKYRYGIRDGQKREFEIYLNKSLLGTEVFKVTSGEEIYLPKKYQRQVANNKGVIKFKLKDSKSKITKQIVPHEKNNILSENQSLSSFSWMIEGSASAFKVLDKSAFLHRGTGIPKEIRAFFLKTELKAGDSLPVSLIYQGNAYKVHIDMEGQDTARTRLFWNSDFTSLLKSTFPHHYQQYSSNQSPEEQIILRLTRLNGFDSYEVSFSGDVPEKAIEQDIQSEEYEEIGPQKEGGAKEYFGKRYERSAANRKQAIRHHGLACNACGFNFEKVYGARGVSYIEVHHIKPIHTYDEKQHVDPNTDLTTLCSNCHRIVHRDPKNILGLQELRELVSMFKGLSDE